MAVIKYGKGKIVGEVLQKEAAQILENIKQQEEALQSTEEAKSKKKKKKESKEETEEPTEN